LRLDVGRGVREREGETDLERGEMERRGVRDRDLSDVCDRDGDCALTTEVGVCERVFDLPRKGDLSDGIVSFRCVLQQWLRKRRLLS
jgi:hypothetical protein